MGRACQLNPRCRSWRPIRALLAGAVFTTAWSSAALCETKAFPDNVYGVQGSEYTRLPERFNWVHNVTNDDELDAALGIVRPGDAIILRDGIYEWDGNPVKVNRWSWPPSAAGTANEAIYFLAESPGGVRFSGTRKWRFMAEHVVVSGFSFNTRVSLHGKYIRFAHNTVEGGNLGIYGDDQEIDNNRFVDTRGAALSMYQKNGFVAPEAGRDTIKRPHIHHNEFRDIAKTKKDREAIMVGYGYEPLPDHYDNAMEATIENNLFERARGDAEVISIKSNKNVIKNNCFVDNDWGAMVIRMGRNNLITGNWFSGMTTKGVVISGHDNVVAFNYFQAGNAPFAIQLHTRAINEPWAHHKWGYYSYLNAKDNLIAANVFSGFRFYLRTYGAVGKFEALPADNKFLDNVFLSNRPAGYSDHSEMLNEGELKASNTFSGNSHLKRELSTGVPCGTGEHVKGPRPTIDVSGMGLLDAPSRVEPPSWW